MPDFPGSKKKKRTGSLQLDNADFVDGGVPEDSAGRQDGVMCWKRPQSALLRIARADCLRNANFSCSGFSGPSVVVWTSLFLSTERDFSFCVGGVTR